MIVFALSTTNKLGLGLIGLAVVAFALVVSMLIPRRRPDFPGRNLGGFLALCLCFFAAMLFAVFYFGRETEEGEALGGNPPAQTEAQTNTGVTATTATTTVATTTPEAGAADLAAGKKVFEGNCAACHTLQDAKSSGTVGPNLDEVQPDAQTVEHQVINGGGAMPPFKGALTDEQIKDVSAYVADASGGS